MQALQKRPVSYFRLDEDSLVDSSGYNRSISAVNRQNGLSVHSDTSRSLVLNGTSSLTLGSPVFVSNINSDFTLEANIVPIAQTEGNSPQSFSENRIVDPLMQTSGYWFSSNATNHPRTTVSIEGKTASRITRNDTGANALYAGRTAGYESPVTTCVGGEVITITFRAMSNTNSTITSQIGYGAATASITAVNEDIALVANTPKTVTRVITIPSTGAWIGQQLNFKIFQAVGGGVAGDWYQIWDVAWFNGVTDNNYFDGNMLGYKWAGTPNNSFSITDPEINSINHVVNPTAMAGSSISNQNGTAAVSTEFAKFGTTSAKATRTQTGVGDNRLAVMQDTYFKTKTNYASAWVYVQNQRTLRVQASGRFNGQGTETFFSQSASYSVPANTWTRIKYQFNAGDNTTLRRIQIVGINFNEGESMWVDGLMVSSTDIDYFDGNFLGAAWAGTPNTSSSILYVSESTQNIVSNDKDGLTINGTVLSFSTRHEGTEAKCSYDLIERRRVHVAGVHTKTKNMLYVDGLLASEVDVPNTAITAPNSTLSSGQTNSGQALEINNIGIYSRALVGQEIMDNALAGAHYSSNDNQSRFNAEDVIVDNSVNTPYIDQTYTSDYPGFLDGVSEYDGSLYPSTAFNLTVQGTWTFSIPLSTPDLAPTIFSSYAMWEGKGFNVEASIENNVWFSISKGSDISQLKGLTTTEKQITFRITFTSGLSEAYLDSFRFVAFDRTSFTSGGFDYTLSNSVVSFDPGLIFNQTEYRGSRVINGSISFKRNVSVENPQNIKTIEVIVKKLGSDDPSLSATYTATGGYTNGELVNTYLQGGYVIKHVVATDGVDTFQNITLSGSFEVMSVKLYPDVLTQTQIKEIIANYTGINRLRIDDGSALTVTESPASTTIYAHDWAIVESSSL